MKTNKLAFVAVLSLSLAACSLAPKFMLPDTKTPETFKEALPDADAGAVAEGEWKVAEPAAHLEKGEWWKVFNDETLNKLEAEAMSGNIPLQGMAARVKQARETANIATSYMFPSVDGTVGATRQKPNAVARGMGGGSLPIENSVRVGTALTYELDLFGRVLDNRRAAKEDAQSAEASMQSMKLSLQADVANAYFTARALDADIAILEEGLGIREESLGILKKRMEIGSITELDIAETVVDLETTRTTLQSVRQQRKETENTLAVLLGVPPAHFQLTPAPFTTEIPAIPAGIPSALLERRPDIAAAAHDLAASNARIGIARAAFFPILSLTANGGLEAATLGDLFNWSSRSWAIGPLMTLPIFGGGRAVANYKRSKSIYEETVAEYRQQVLIAFRDVEDGLSRLKTLSDQSASQKIAEDAALRASDLATKRYDSGDTGYLESITARKNALEAQRYGVTVHREKLVSTVGLIRALGGGW